MQWVWRGISLWFWFAFPYWPMVLNIFSCACWSFVYIYILFLAVLGLCCCVWAFSLVAARRGYSLLRCAGFSLRWLLLLRSTGSRHAGSVVVAHGLSCSTACGIFPDQGSNMCPLHWQADSQPLRHQGSPVFSHFVNIPWCTKFFTFVKSNLPIFYFVAYAFSVTSKNPLPNPIPWRFTPLFSSDGFCKVLALILRSLIHLS